MIRIGLTGGIGSGKSVVAQIFAAMGIPTYDCDARAKSLYNSDAELRREMIALFGEGIYQAESGEIDRARLANLIFGNAERMQAVTRLVHPAVRRDIDRWLEEQRYWGKELVAIESAILLDSEGLRAKVDVVVAVTAPEELRLARAMARDKSSEEAIRQRMRAQRPEAELGRLADYSINNDSKTALLPQLEALITELRERDSHI